MNVHDRRFIWIANERLLQHLACCQPLAMSRVDIPAHVDAKTQYANAVEATEQWDGNISAPSDEYKSPRHPLPQDGVLVLENK